MLKNGLSPRQQGDLGEVSALEWFVGAGAFVFTPVGHSPDYDLVADLGAGVRRVQVKTTTCLRNDRWVVTLATRGGNQSWSGLVKVFDADRCDLLFVLAGDGRRWLIPADAVEGASGLLLGGPKYADYEIDAGRPITGGSPDAR